MYKTVRSRIPSLLIASLVLVTLLASACNGRQDTANEARPQDGTSSEEPTTTPPDGDSESPDTEPAEKTTLLVYLVRGETLGVGAREVPATETPAKAAMEALLAGPTDAEKEFGLDSAIPETTALLGVDIADGKATVDLSAEYGSGGGSLSMLLRVAQVVYTLTQFESVDAVDFELDGEPIDYLGGEGVEVIGVDRADFEAQLPPILLESPCPGQTITSPVTVRGLANTFEGSFVVNVTDPEGLIIAEQNVTYTGGTGIYGTFEAEIPFETDREGLGAVIAFEKSPQDGSNINVVEVPVRMAP